MGSVDRENLYQDIEGSSSAVTTPGDVMTTTSVQLDTPTTPLPPPSPRTEQVIFLDDHLHISDVLGF